MRQVMQILGILLLLGLLYAIAVGLGLTNSFKHRKNNVKSQMITDFEYPNDDFDWTTGGYVKMEPSTENQTHGKRSAKLTFFLASQFYPTPTPGANWAPQVVMDTDSVTRLPVYEWQDYANLKMDVFNDQAQPVTYWIEVADAHAYIYRKSDVLAPKKVTNVSIPLSDLVQQRVDLSNIRSLKFWLDMSGATQPLVVYLDNVRLEGDAATAAAAAKNPPKPKTP